MTGNTSDFNSAGEWFEPQPTNGLSQVFLDFLSLHPSKFRDFIQATTASFVLSSSCSIVQPLNATSVCYSVAHSTTHSKTEWIMCTVNQTGWQIEQSWLKAGSHSSFWIIVDEPKANCIYEANSIYIFHQHRTEWFISKWQQINLCVLLSVLCVTVLINERKNLKKKKLY